MAGQAAARKRDEVWVKKDPMRVDSGLLSEAEWELLNTSTRRCMMMQDHKPEDQTAIRTDLGAIFVSLELSRSTWLVTSLSPGGGEKMSKHSVRGGDVSGLLTQIGRAHV